jgi:hypothetical protein
MKVVFREMRGGRSDPSPSGIGRVKRARQFEGEEKELTFFHPLRFRQTGYVFSFNLNNKNRILMRTGDCSTRNGWGSSWTGAMHNARTDFVH